jgi:hypothetical protein
MISLVIKRYVGQENGHARRVLNTITSKALPRSASVPTLRPSPCHTQSNTSPMNNSSLPANNTNSFDLKRSLTLGNLDFRRSTTHVSKPNSTCQIPQRSYACRTGNMPENITQVGDPQSFVNNPSIGKKNLRHAETHVQKCQHDPDCAQKTCTQVCGTPGDRYAAEHWTHSNPQTNAGPVVPVSPTDYQNNPKQQNAVVYRTPHTTSQTPEIPFLTQFVNDPNHRAAVEPHENIP